MIKIADMVVNAATVNMFCVYKNVEKMSLMKKNKYFKKI